MQIDLAKEELDLVIESLKIVYLKKIKKLREAPRRGHKEIEELSFHQVVMQKMLATRNLHEKEISDFTGCQELVRGEDANATGT
jgi:hypothetical protein